LPQELIPEHFWDYILP